MIAGQKGSSGRSDEGINHRKAQKFREVLDSLFLRKEWTLEENAPDGPAKMCSKP